MNARKSILEQDGDNAIVIASKQEQPSRRGEDTAPYPTLIGLVLIGGKTQNDDVKIEHFALQVPDPAEMADWYVKYLGFSIARQGGEPSYARFLADTSGSVMMEIYRNPAATVPDYWKADPLLMHVAYVSDHPTAERDRLVQAGAAVVDDLMTTPSGDSIVMLRDPWGVPIQLVKRAKPMI